MTSSRCGSRFILMGLVMVVATTAAMPSLSTQMLPAKIIKGPRQNPLLARVGQDRQIQPLNCVSPTTGETGVCMFAWNCVEARGSHLGTCIDRFYFGSCCKLPDVINAGDLDHVEPQVPTNVFEDSSAAASLTNPIENVEQPSAVVDIAVEAVTTSTTTLAPETTPVETTTTATSTTTESTTSEPTTTTTEPTTTTTEPSTTTTEATTSATESTTTLTEAETSTTTASPTLATSEDSTTLSSSADATTHQEEPEVTQTEVATEPSSTSADPSPSPGDSDAALSVEPVVQDTENPIQASESSQATPASPIEHPDQPILPAVVPAQTDIDNGSEMPLKNMTRFEACGRRPWFNVPNYELAYPDGVQNGASEAPMKRTDRGFENLDFGDFPGRRRNSKYLRGWERQRQPRIVNGQTADYGEWPWQVSLRQWRTATYLHKCGCALLSENWAITAAHCVENVAPDDLLLRMGEYDLNSMAEPHPHIDRKVQIVASHPKFDPKTFEYDLALLRFYEPVEFQYNVLPICIPEDDQPLVGETAWVTGWGRLYEDGPLPSRMQEVDLPVINNTQCERMYRDAGYVEHIPNIFICAGYAAGGKDSCEGDSGGPMVVQRNDGRFMLSGVISWGIGCAEKNQPGVYTRISEFRSWIEQILKF